MGARMPSPISRQRPPLESHVKAVNLMSLILNVLWLVFGGVWMAAGWLIAAVIMAITIIGLPFARAALNIALYALLPFGHTAVPRERITGREDIGTGAFGAI